MWPIPTLEYNLITIAFSPRNLVCSLMQKKITYDSLLTISGYKRYELNNLELNNLTLFNPTTIKQLIINFLAQHNKKNAFVGFSLDGLGISEQFVTHHTSTPQYTDFGIKPSSYFLWGYRFIYQNQNGEYVFYLYKVPHALLLRYKLLAISANLNLISITTQTIALIEAYTAIHGANFRQSQLAVDMIKQNNITHNIISTTALKKIISLPPTVSFAQESTHIATTYGIFATQGLRL